MHRVSLILVAEDDANDVFLLRRAFQKAGVGCRIVDVRNGREAVNYLTGQPPYSDREQYPLPCLLLVDVKMPLMNGFELLEWLQTQPGFASLPAVVLSSSEQTADIVEAKKFGAREYLVKPTLITDLVKIVEDLHARWLQQEQEKENGRTNGALT